MTDQSEGQPQSESIELTNSERKLVQLANDQFHPERKKTLVVSKVLEELEAFKLGKELRSNTTGDYYSLERVDFGVEIQSKTGYRGIMVDENQAVIAKLDDKTGIILCSLYDCTAYGIKLADNHLAAGHFLYPDHNGAIMRLLEPAKQKYTPQLVVYDTPRVGVHRNNPDVDTQYHTDIVRHVPDEDKKIVSNENSHVHHEGYNNAMIITPKSILYLESPHNPAPNLFVQYRVVAKKIW